MSHIEVSGFVCLKFKNIARRVAMQVIELTKQSESLEIAIKFVSKKEIQRLNKETRNIDKVTDVLSYPSFDLKPGEIMDEKNGDFLIFQTQDGRVHFGDMAICFSQTKKQAKEFGNSVANEVKKLVIHSMLHLMGYDHIKDEDYELMNKKEIELFEKISI